MEALAREPDAPAIHYQESGFLAAPVSRPCLFQDVHGKQLANPCVGDPPPRIYEVAQEPGCGHLDALYALGVRYVIVDRVRPDIVECDEAIDGWREVASDEVVGIFALPDP